MKEDNEYVVKGKTSYSAKSISGVANNFKKKDDVCQNLYTRTQKIAKVLRIATLPPITSAILLILLQIFVPSSFAGIGHFVMTICFICLCPVLAYPISYIVPSLRKQGRAKQRELAVAFSVVGYTVGFLIALYTKAPINELLIFSTYFFSVIFLIVSDVVFGEKASGHACSTFGPICMLCYSISPVALSGLIVLGLVFYSSMVLKRHTLNQLLIGAFCSELAFLLSIFIFV